jgi:uncharacterized protein (DUF488 family)
MASLLLIAGALWIATCHLRAGLWANASHPAGRVMSKQKPPQDVKWPKAAIFTVGHSTLPLEEFIALLEAYSIECLADIRTVPRSRHNPQFNADTLGKALRRCKIDYVPLQALGGLRHARKDSPNTGWHNASFRGYADYMQTQEFARGLDELIALSGAKRTAIMCAEAVPWRCHRSLVADALSVRGIPVVEILSATSYREHKLTPFAHVEGTRITYPPEQAALL